MQPCSVTCLACWLLLSLEKYFHPQGVFCPSCFLCLVFATCWSGVSGQKFCRDKGKLEEKLLGDTPHSPWLQGGYTLCLDRREHLVTSSTGCSHLHCQLCFSWSSSFLATSNAIGGPANADRINLPYSISPKCSFSLRSQRQRQRKEDVTHFPIKYSRFQGIIETNRKISQWKRVSHALPLIELNQEPNMIFFSLHIRCPQAMLRFALWTLMHFSFLKSHFINVPINIQSFKVLSLPAISRNGRKGSLPVETLQYSTSSAHAPLRI